jgi:hypothetical protein
MEHTCRKWIVCKLGKTTAPRMSGRLIRQLQQVAPTYAPNAICNLVPEVASDDRSLDYLNLLPTSLAPLTLEDPGAVGSLVVRGTYG